VFLASNIHDETIRVAIKVINKNMLNAEQIKEAYNEVGVLHTLDHPNVVDYLETYSDSQNIYLIMENCPGGELFDLPKSNDPSSTSNAETKG
jgi:serine/threonine protein kinase